MARGLAVVALLMSGGCGLAGPMCVARQERGTVTALSGGVGAGEISMHRVMYDTRGSQNDARIDWPGARDADAPRLHVYATLASCESFSLPAESNTGNCGILAQAGWTPIGIASTAIVSHGRGNPERLGSPPEYKLWITSDRATNYSITVTYFYGPDC